MHQESSKGISLSIKAYGDESSILEIFTQERGLIALFVPPYKKFRAVRDTLLHASWLYTRKNKHSLFRLFDFSPHKHYLACRKNFLSLRSASLLQRSILDLHMPEKPATLVYEMLLRYLEAIEIFPHPLPFLWSFRCKLLLHEGLFSIQKKEDTFVIDYPAREAPSPFPLFFDYEESQIIFIMTYSRSLKSIAELSLSQNLEKKMELLYKKVLLGAQLI